MKKILFIMILILSTFTTLSALEVDVDEISKSGRVNFTNYEGTGSKYESVSQIKSIGYQLSYKKKQGGESGIFRYHMKYHVLRVASEEPEKYSSDIFFIDKNARVDHIKNVRRIISAYLEGSYSYTAREADAIALYLTYYNAVYRGNTGYFASKYSQNILKHITTQNAGISTKYNEWPGKTAIVIPLTKESKKGKLEKIDPFAISDEKTSREVKKDKETKDERKELIELKKEDIKKSKTGLEEDKKKLEEKKKTVTEEKKKTEEKKEEIVKKKEEIKKEKEETSKIKDPEEKKKKEEEIKKKEEEVKKEEKQIKESEEKIKKEEETIKKTEEETEKKEEEIKKKEENVKKETSEETAEKKDEKDTSTEETLTKKEEELKKKEEELDKREDLLKDKQTDPNVFGLKLYYLKVKDYLEGGHYNNELYMINASTKKIDFKSPISNICGRRYDVFSGGIVVITHQGDHVSGHRLTLIDREKLTVKATGVDDIFWRSFIEIRENSIYAIVKDGNSYHLGKFDQELKLVAKSKEKINEDTFITFFDEFIYINREDKSIIVLNKNDFTLAGEIKP
ncbi:MAG TPA: P83/100 family protein [Spirochaetota bacterium]|nr:P83/100 family protein [Spirochaetota bacterium]